MLADAVEVVDDDEFDELERLLHSAERQAHAGAATGRLSGGVEGAAGCKRPAAVSPATLKQQQQPNDKEGGPGHSLFAAAAFFDGKFDGAWQTGAAAHPHSSTSVLANVAAVEQRPQYLQHQQQKQPPWQHAAQYPSSDRASTSGWGTLQGVGSNSAQQGRGIPVQAAANSSFSSGSSGTGNVTSSSLRFSSGGCDRRHQDSSNTSQVAAAAGLTRSRSWSVGQWPQQQQQQQQQQGQALWQHPQQQQQQQQQQHHQQQQPPWQQQLPPWQQQKQQQKRSLVMQAQPQQQQQSCAQHIQQQGHAWGHVQGAQQQQHQQHQQQQQQPARCQQQGQHRAALQQLQPPQQQQLQPPQQQLQLKQQQQQALEQQQQRPQRQSGDRGTHSVSGACAPGPPAAAAALQHPLQHGLSSTAAATPAAADPAATSAPAVATASTAAANAGATAGPAAAAPPAAQGPAPPALVPGGAAAAAANRRKLPSSMASRNDNNSSSSGGNARGAGGSGGSSGGRQQEQRQQQQQQQQRQQWANAAPRLKKLPWAGSVRYACTAAEVDAACRQLMAAGPPSVVGFDIEWKPSFVKNQPPNKAALVQLAYYCKGSQDCQPRVGDKGRGVVVLLLHILHAGIPRKLQEVLLDDQVIKVGVNIGGDVLKLSADYGAQVFGAVDLSDAAHGRQLRAVEGVTANIQPKKWSLAGLVEEVFDLELPKPQHIRLGDWERKPLTPEQQRYAAMDAYACLLLHWELQGLPSKQTLSQQLIEAMRHRAAAGRQAGTDWDCQ